MPGKPYQSKIAPYEEQVFNWLDDGVSYRMIARRLADAYGLCVTHNAVFSFVNAKSRRQRAQPPFLRGLDDDIRDALVRQLVALWTHDSTAIEGNTLTLGDTQKVLEFGLTISGKSLKEHAEVYGHARAIDLVMQMLHAPLAMVDIHALHRAIMPKSPIDVDNPIGDWKRVYNGTTGVINGRPTFIEYAAPEHVPVLMARWVDAMNGEGRKAIVGGRRSADGGRRSAVDAYVWAHMSFVRIHPYFDGNGRLARLLANIPILRAGLPPLLIPPEKRSPYIDILWENQISLGALTPRDEQLPEHATVDQFRALAEGCWSESMALVDAARAQQEKRDKPAD